MVSEMVSENDRIQTEYFNTNSNTGVSLPEGNGQSPKERPTPELVAKGTALIAATSNLSPESATVFQSAGT
jgi:hypothetical protein